ncbi:hypothetical protein PG984_016271 [Apiospora sp. TS-2023a]
MPSEQERRQDSVPEGSPERRGHRSGPTVSSNLLNLANQTVSAIADGIRQGETQADPNQHHESGSSDDEQPLPTQAAPQAAQASSPQLSTSAAAIGAIHEPSQNSPGQQVADGARLDSSSPLPNADDYEVVLHTGEPNTGSRLTFECRDGTSVVANVGTRDDALRAARSSGDGHFLWFIVNDSLKPLLRSHELMPPGT